jgi:hypothetical protein
MFAGLKRPEGLTQMQNLGNATRRTFLKSTLLASAPLLTGPMIGKAQAQAAKPESTKSDRQKWLEILERVSQPVLEAISQQKLRATMPVECVKGQEEARAQSTHLEAVGRLLCGLAPWLEAEPGTIPQKRRCASAIASGRGWPSNTAAMQNLLTH